MAHNTEANMTINGVELTFVQSMTVRVAMSSFAMTLQEDGLGNDEHGKFMCKSYLKNIREINRLIFERMLKKKEDFTREYLEYLRKLALHMKVGNYMVIHDDGYAVSCFRYMWE